MRDIDRSHKRRRRAPLLDRCLADLAAPRGGAVSRAELLDLGLTRGGIDSRVREGRLHPIFRGVYAVGHPRLARNGLYHAAVLAAAPGAALGHHSAGALWDVRPGERLEVTVPGSRRGAKGAAHASLIPPARARHLARRPARHHGRPHAPRPRRGPRPPAARARVGGGGPPAAPRRRRGPAGDGRLPRPARAAAARRDPRPPLRRRRGHAVGPTDRMLDREPARVGARVRALLATTATASGAP